jgi:hypothetical protein
MIGKAGMTHRYCPDEGIVQTKVLSRRRRGKAWRHLSVLITRQSYKIREGKVQMDIRYKTGA